jgi:hypothetical protein
LILEGGGSNDSALSESCYLTKISYAEERKTIVNETSQWIPA